MIGPIGSEELSLLPRSELSVVPEGPEDVDEGDNVADDSGPP